MKNKKRFRLFFIFILTLVASLTAVNIGLKHIPPKNVVLLTVDTLRYDLGHSNYIPALEELKDSSVVFDKYYTSASETGPSYSSILTCKNVQTHHVTGNGVTLENQETLAEILKRNGYNTYGIVSLGVLQKRFGFGKGFDFYSDEFPGEWVKSGNEILPQAIGPINAGNLKEPFFLWIHLSDPHEAYRIKYQTDNKDEQRNLIQQEYLRKVQLTGLYIEEIMSSIKKSKYRFNTLTVFTSDHGEGLGNHDWDGHVENVYNELIHVPLWFKYPIVGDAEALKNNQVARSIDLAPTILDILHVKANISCDGSSLFEEKERIAYSETHKPDASKDKYSFILNNEKCIYTPETSITECYMLSTDPYETTPVDKPFSLTGEALLQRMKDRETISQPLISSEDKEKLQALGYTK